MLGQKDVARRLEACYPDPIAIEECLSGYIFWKYLRGGNSDRVLYKIRLLVCFLRMTGRAHIVDIARDQIKVLSMEVILGGGRVGVLPTTTPQGRAMWNDIRRSMNSKQRASTDAQYGGPGPVGEFLTREQSRRSTLAGTTRTIERDAFSESYFVNRQRLSPLTTDNLDLPDYQTASERATTLPGYVDPDLELYRIVTSGSAPNRQLRMLMAAIDR